MLSSELVKKLEDAGFPSKNSDGFSVCGHCGDGGPEGLPPTLSELIEACGIQFLGFEKNDRSWTASSEEDGNMPVSVNGGTPEEAVAHLWLALNKK